MESILSAGGIDSQYLVNQVYDIPLSAGIGKKGAFTEMLEKTAEKEKNTPLIPKKEPEIDRNSKLFEMCRELETFLLKNLVTSMRNTVQKSGLMDSGFAGKFYEDMLYDEYTKSFANNAGLGFAEMAYRELRRKELSLSA